MAEPVVIDPTDFDAVGVLTEAIVSLRAHVLIREVDASATVSAPEGWHPLVINAKQGGSLDCSLQRTLGVSSPQCG